MRQPLFVFLQQLKLRDKKYIGNDLYIKEGIRLNNKIEIIYKNIDKMTDKKFNEYLKTISKELTEEFNRDLFYNKGLTRFLDVRKTMRSMKIVYKLEN